MGSDSIYSRASALGRSDSMGSWRLLDQFSATHPRRHRREPGASGACALLPDWKTAGILLPESDAPPPGSSRFACRRLTTGIVGRHRLLTSTGRTGDGPPPRLAGPAQVWFEGGRAARRSSRVIAPNLPGYWQRRARPRGAPPDNALARRARSRRSWPRWARAACSPGIPSGGVIALAWRFDARAACGPRALRAGGGPLLEALGDAGDLCREQGGVRRLYRGPERDDSDAVGTMVDLLVRRWSRWRRSDRSR